MQQQLSNFFFTNSNQITVEVDGETVRTGTWRSIPRPTKHIDYFQLERVSLPQRETTIELGRNSRVIITHGAVDPVSTIINLPALRYLDIETIVDDINALFKTASGLDVIICAAAVAVPYVFFHSDDTTYIRSITFLADPSDPGSESDLYAILGFPSPSTLATIEVNHTDYTIDDTLYDRVIMASHTYDLTGRIKTAYVVLHEPILDSACLPSFDDERLSGLQVLQAVDVNYTEVSQSFLGSDNSTPVTFKLENPGVVEYFEFAVAALSGDNTDVFNLLYPAGTVDGTLKLISLAD
jgi:hypothetical protein